MRKGFAQQDADLINLPQANLKRVGNGLENLKKKNAYFNHKVILSQVLF